MTLPRPDLWIGVVFLHNSSATGLRYPLLTLLSFPGMSLPLESSVPNSPRETSVGTNSSTAFLALLGAVSAGLPQLILPTATLIEFIGNTVMGAVVVAIVDSFLLRRTLPASQLKKGRMLALIFVSAALTIVTYRSPARAFQDVFDTAPPRDNTVHSLAARARTLSRPGQIAYRLYFYSEPQALLQIEDRLKTAYQASFDPSTQDWPTYLATNLPKDSQLLPLATRFKDPESRQWQSVKNNRTTTTLLLRDKSTGLTLVEHTPG